ncbi:DNA-deoxyinosine glycosylase [Accumulibacter sp.]|uniref:DNA-deoxyinosine glycosylase n=1 Tax=Accumulibacter sp. TaxID=2053492 RepID=UPI0025ED5FAC|nr:DNA-deoxyinosine glycosylase [Accumulibacter sp.]MCM8595001.1 DNA-deoxyinosine glycosylase [Accumulibacter sp.]MCM8625640.1 DNA-deoxyinosine glycosylase [Accumulibacter sp.]MDS4049147.1 DNA-deoxyinosine glycosylase [Accumulibacter sp.]
MADDRPPVLCGLPPILDEHVRTLILGSFPSPASLAAQHYYAHRQNQFWRLLAALLDEPLGEIDYPAKQVALLRARIGVWDVYRQCRRVGALDAAIESPEFNDFSLLRAVAPQLRCVCFNGQTAGRLAGWFRQAGYATVVLPSSSPAYTLAFERKLAAWRAAGLGRRLAGGV